MPQAPPSLPSPDRDGGVDGRGEIALSHAFGLEQAAVGEQAVQLHSLVVEQDVQADPEGGQGGVELGPDEGGEVEPAARSADEQRPALVDAR